MICHLKSILTVVGMSQQELADAVEKHRNTITSLSRNKSIPSLDLAYDISDTINKKAKLLGIEKYWTVEDIWER